MQIAQGLSHLRRVRTMKSRHSEQDADIVFRDILAETSPQEVHSSTTAMAGIDAGAAQFQGFAGVVKQEV